MDRRTLIKAGALFIFAPKFGSWYKQYQSPKLNAAMWAVTESGLYVPMNANYDGTLYRGDLIAKRNEVITAVVVDTPLGRRRRYLNKAVVVNPFDQLNIKYKVNAL